MVNPIFDPADAPDPDRVFANYLKTCEMLGIEPVPRMRAQQLVGEWNRRLLDGQDATGTTH